MMPEEKRRLLEWLDSGSRWCQHVEAQDSNANPVHYDDATAAAWDITGALCRLFGDKRAGILFAQLDRHFHGKRRALGWPPRDKELDGMVALQDFNDRVDTTFEIVRARLETAPVWTSERSTNGAAAAQRAGFSRTDGGE
jgi:hypothetical protein